MLVLSAEAIRIIVDKEPKEGVVMTQQQDYTQQAPVQPQPVHVIPISLSNRLAAFLLALFLGFLGAHRFYVGKVGTAILMIITAGGLGVWWLVDVIMILVGGFRDKAGLPVKKW